MTEHRRLLLVVGLVAVALVAIALALSPFGERAPATSVSERLPVRAAYYVPGLPQTGAASGRPSPVAATYRGDDRTVMARQIAAMQYAGLDAAIAPWSGKGTSTADRLAVLLDVAETRRFHVAPSYEKESGDADPGPDEVTADVSTLLDLAKRQPAWLRVDGKPVLFVDNSGRTGCDDVAKWARATSSFSDAYVDMKVFPGYAECPQQPSSWHQQSASVRFTRHGRFASSISPGFWSGDKASPRLARDLGAFCAAAVRQRDTATDWKLLTSFNQWSDGSAAEAGTSWQSPSGYGDYLDVLRQVNRGGGCDGSTPAPGPTASQDPSPDPSPSMASPSSPSSPSSPPVASPAHGTVVWSVGDLCSSSTTAGCGAVGRLVSHDTSAAALLVLGDNQYETGALSDFENYYDPLMGAGVGLKQKTYPVVGNHEYLTSGASGYFSYFGSRAGDPHKGYYATDVAGWRLVAANSNCAQVGGCAPESPQGRFIAQQLASAGPCALVFEHHPAITDGQYAPGTPTGEELFALAFQGGADLFLSGHDHNYQRFAPRDPDGSVDPDRGLTQFVVGTGGRSHYSFSDTDRSQYRSSQNGALRLTLGARSYAFEFVDVSGTVLDSGTGTCH